VPLAPSLLREGRAMLDAVCADLRAIGMTVETMDGDDPSTFRDHAASADYSLIIAPEFDGILERLCSDVEQSGGRLLGPSAAAVKLCADKLELHRWFKNRRVRTPDTWTRLDDPGYYPRVYKPRDGAGSQHTFVAWSLNDLVRKFDEYTAAPGELLVQEFVEGFAASVAVLIGPNERVALQPCSQRLSDDGRFQYQGGYTPIDGKLARRARKLALRAVEEIPGLCGYVGVDLILGYNASSDYVIEINPRLTTSYVGLRQAARFNIAEMMVRIVRGDSLPKLAWRKERIDFAADGTVNLPFVRATTASATERPRPTTK
jgi:predicted ATP-grasp superfamily ATP-dependent carboligase